MAELMADLADNGLLHPITLKPDGLRFVLIAGRRRLTAAARLGWTTIAAAIRDVSEAKEAEIRFLENATRAALSPVEEAKQLAAMLDTNTDGVEGVARRIGRRVDWVLDRLEICDWPDELMQAVHEKKISLGAAQRLARIQPPDLCLSRVRYAILHGINVSTANLWLQDSRTQFSESSDVSLSRSSATIEPMKTETAFHCFLCDEKFALEQTVAQRVCVECLRTVQLQRIGQSITPPLHQEPPRQNPYPTHADGSRMLGPHENFPGDNDTPDA